MKRYIILPASLFFAYCLLAQYAVAEAIPCATVETNTFHRVVSKQTQQLKWQNKVGQVPIPGIIKGWAITSYLKLKKGGEANWEVLKDQVR